MAKTAKAGASTRSFANLLGLPPKAAKKVEGDPSKTPDDDDKDKEAKARAEQEPDTEDDGKAQCAVCEGTGKDEDGDKCEACDGTGEVGAGDDPVKEPADAAKADDDPETKGRKAERIRWSRVLAHKSAGDGRAAMACHLLSTTDMKASAVIAALADVPTVSAAAPRDSLYKRMSTDSRPLNPGTAGGVAKPNDFAAMMAAAVGKVRAKASK